MHAQAPRQNGQIEHQRRVSEPEAGQVDHDVPAGVDGPGKGTPAEPLSRPVFVASTTQYGGGVIELDDPGNLHNGADPGKADTRFLVLPREEANPNGGGAPKWFAAPGRGRVLHFSSMATVEAVTGALRDVIDPELGLDFVELGLIYDVEVEGGTVRVTYTLTSPGCPIGPQVSEQIEEFVSELDGVEEVQPTMTFSPPWTPERMSEDAKFALGF
jgi:metal-sulfur cluster biosynthetic enzyme